MLQIPAYQLVQTPICSQIHRSQILQNSRIILFSWLNIRFCHFKPIVHHLTENPVQHFAFPISLHLSFQLFQPLFQSNTGIIVLLKGPFIMALAIKDKIGLPVIINCKQFIHLLIVLKKSLVSAVSCSIY